MYVQVASARTKELTEAVNMEVEIVDTDLADTWSPELTMYLKEKLKHNVYVPGTYITVTIYGIARKLIVRLIEVS